MNKRFWIFQCLLCTVLFFGLPSISVDAQKVIHPQKSGSIKDTIPVVSVMRSKDTAKQQSSDSSISSTLSRLGELNLQINKSRNRLKRGYETNNSIETLAPYEDLINILDSNLTTKGGIEELNLRNISSYKVLLTQFYQKLNLWKKDIENYTYSTNDGIYEINKKFKFILSLETPDEDSTLNAQYLESVTNTRLKLTQLNRLRDSLFKKLGVMQNKTTKLFIKTNELLDEVAQRVNMYSVQIFTKTNSVIWKPNEQTEKINLTSSIIDSIKPAFILLGFYLFNSPFLILTSILIALAFFLWFSSNYRSLKASKNQDSLNLLKYLNRQRWLDFFLFLFMLMPFMFNSPPALFMELMWLGAALISTILLWSKYSQAMRGYWLAIIFLYLYFGLDNLLYSYSEGERWYLLAGNIMAIGIGVGVNKHEKTLKQHWVFRAVIVLFILSNFLAFVLNIFGWFPLAKLLSISSVIQVVLAACLYVLCEVITEAIYIQLENKKNNATGAYREFEEIRKTFLLFLNLGGVVYWFMALIWSLSFSEIINMFLRQQLDYSINIGNFTFTVGSIAAFFLSIWLSVLLANLLNVFFGNSEYQFANTKKSKIGSWMVIIRLSVISIGILVAFAAAGIPMDKLAIIFGALSVGIGFGLQHIVNNLVSGIVLAFEKPMQIGDVIEIGSQLGTVKQIGLRSSKITTFDGADIIVPNGDFISQKLINWTLSNNYRRIELFVSVAYGNDIERITKLINDVVVTVAHVMAYPKPQIVVHEFNDSGLNFRVLIWTSDFDSWVTVKSNSYEIIYKTFAENGIEIPYPKTDVFIKSVPGKGE